MTTHDLRLGRFQTEALLGQGGATETYRARLAEAQGDERRFVVTLLRGERGRAEPQLVARFVEAARRLAGLDLPGFVRVVELSEGPGQIYAGHEFKAGVDLAQLRGQAAPRGFMDARLVGLLARKIAERLAPLHARPQGSRVHGGLNPGNVLVSPEGEVLLLDCGLAEAMRPRSNAFVSRWFFAAPEQVMGGAALPASDLYSVGALIFFLFAGRPPFMADTAEALRDKIAAGLPALPNMPPWLFSVMARLLSSEAALRPKSAGDLARQISAAMLAAEAGHMTGTTRVPAPSSTPLPASPSDPLPEAPPSPASSGASLAALAGGPSLDASAAASAGRAKAQGPDQVPSVAEPVVPFALDEAITADERPRVAARIGAVAQPGVEPVVPFSLEPGSSAGSGSDGAGEDGRGDQGLSGISADDPDVGVVYDDDDEEQEQVEVGVDGKVKRRRRRRVRIPVWYRSELARRMSRLGLIPLIGLLLVAVVTGFFFYREWATTRAETERRNAQFVAEAARRAAELRPPKPPESPSLPAGHLVVKSKPSGATVWVDGEKKDNTPATLITTPGPHRLVVTMAGYRMLRDVVDSSQGLLWEREMFAAPHLDDGRVPLTVTCLSENKYPIFVDGKDSGELCPASDLRIEPGRHSVGVFVIPQNRIWTFDREVQLNRPHRVQFNY